MCLILFGVDASPDFPFILAANRDEFHARPTRPMEFWPEHPDLLAGKDLQAGGTWFGVNTRGRFAALTNYRDLTTLRPKGPSRGEIIPGVLDFPDPIPDYLHSLDNAGDQYSGFNLLTGESGGSVYWYSNQARSVTRIPPGIHGLSNHLLDTPWPKVIRGKKRLNTIIKKDPLNDAAFFSMLADSFRPEDPLLPDTGVGMEWERILSPLFIQSPTYGTRSSTLMRISKTNEIRVTERTWRTGPEDETRDRTFTIRPS